MIKNKKAYYLYDIIEEFEAGIILVGNEVKSIRNNDISFSDSYVIIYNGEIWLKNMRISRYKNSYLFDRYNDIRDIKLLLKKREITKIAKQLQNKGLTCVPLSVLSYKNRIKINIGICKGKKNWNKKESIKERDIKRQTILDLNI